jgi:hypothetical protein
MNVSGHRISTTEVESALVSHPKVAEAAVVGATDETTGQGIVAFVILRGGVRARRPRATTIVTELRNHVAHEIGPIAKPRQIMVVPELPKTRSGKIMRRLLRDVAENREVGDVTTLADPATNLMPGRLGLDLSLGTWAADGLLAVFFFVVGLELKHELVLGSLSKVREAVVPAAAALGGMIVPALIFVVINLVMADDRARSRAGASRWRRTSRSRSPCWPSSDARLPVALRAFLLTLAVVDDLGAIAVIAIFYSEKFSFLWLAAWPPTWPTPSHALPHHVAVPLRPPRAPRLVLHARERVHATIAGVVFGFLTRVRPDPGEAEAPADRMSTCRPDQRRALRAPVRLLRRGRRLPQRRPSWSSRSARRWRSASSWAWSWASPSASSAGPGSPRAVHARHPHARPVGWRDVGRSASSPASASPSPCSSPSSRLRDAFLGLVFLLLTLAWVLVELGLPTWAGFGIVTLLVILLAVVMGLVGRKQLESVKGPERSQASIEKSKALFSRAPSTDPVEAPTGAVVAPAPDARAS